MQYIVKLSVKINDIEPSMRCHSHIIIMLLLSVTLGSGHVKYEDF